MLINILTLIGIGTVAWSVAKLVIKIMNWRKPDERTEKKPL